MRIRPYARRVQEHGVPDLSDTGTGTGTDGHSQEFARDATPAGAERTARVCTRTIGIPDEAPMPKG